MNDGMTQSDSPACIHNDCYFNYGNDGLSAKWGDEGMLEKNTLGDAFEFPFSEEQAERPSTPAYSIPTFTQMQDGQFYFGYPVAIPQFVNCPVVYVARPDDARFSPDTWNEEDVEVDSTHVGALVYYRGWKDPVANWGIVRVKEPIMGQETFIAPNVPVDCRRRGDVRFVLTPNKVGRDRWSVEIVEAL